MNYDIFKYETYMLSASVELLRGVGVSSTYVQQGNEDLPTPRVELQYTPGDPIGHVRILKNTGSFYDAFNGTLNALVITERTNNPTYHADFLSKVVHTLSNFKNFSTGSVLPYHLVVKADLQGTTPSVESEENRDISAVSIDVTLYIKTEAWLS